AHHADVGGRTPGSMPADSRTLDEEGVVIEPSRLDDDLIRELASRMRGPRQRQADLRAQVAANRTGANRLVELVERYGLDTVREAMSETLDYAERRTRARIAEIEDGAREASDLLEAPEGGRALGQGTMNNVTLGNDDFTYYETIAGGQGACPDADGPSAVHVAMSNTLNTPVEALELEFPLRAVEYAVRRGSGGAGRHRGGDGVIRELEAEAEMSYSVIA